MTELDRTDTALQTLYAIWDNTKFKAGTSVTPLDGPSDGATKIADSPPLYGRTHLVQQTSTQTVISVSGRTLYKTSNNPVPYTGAGAKRGWYMDWPGLGERTIRNGGLTDDGKFLYMPSSKPAVGSLTAATEETCTPDATPRQTRDTVVDIFRQAVAFTHLRHEQ